MYGALLGVKSSMTLRLLRAEDRLVWATVCVVSLMQRAYLAKARLHSSCFQRFIAEEPLARAVLHSECQAHIRNCGEVLPCKQFCQIL